MKFIDNFGKIGNHIGKCRKFEIFKFNFAVRKQWLWLNVKFIEA